MLSKMIKQRLGLAKEIQCRDFDVLTGHTSIVFMGYMFLACHARMSLIPKASAICFMHVAIKSMTFRYEPYAVFSN